ncbi:peptide/nickel transport system substrate-binding protein [Thermocatellispora tengchongensis]|uniref:Peptide/nickel transport system substrate-binding protein n=1 Tax=Thermocatellispora tengchongensis TaxID=1073253 RepID=A0A840P704_9ACTN|nr:ABC transporter substrate-binding protein [Thermocatellispora tengchongensis]MBB5134366.1 peptide/nickel transport system substrate-binding protein [Thermocatellispora tengchongensis]
MRHTRPAVGVTALVLLAAACSPGPGAAPGAATPAPAKPGYLAVADPALPGGGTLNFQVHVDTGAATGLDPQLADVATSWQLMSLVYETLVTVGPDFSIQPMLAERWETPDPTTYVFHLREGVKFSNGRAMTADDVVGSLKRLLASKSVWVGQLGPVKSVAKDGDAAVRVTLKEPYAPFLAALANVPAAVLPMKEVEDKSVDLATTMLGTGPYVVGEHRQDVSWSFRRNPEYWAQGRPALDAVNVTIAPEEAARIAALQNGSASMATLGNVDSAGMLAGAANVQVLSQATTDFYYLMLNTQAPGSKFADPRVRQAVNLAMNRTQIAEVATGGQGKPTGVTPAGLPGACDPATLPSATGGGAEAARRLLAEAGAQNLSFTLAIYSTEPAPAVAQVIQQNLQQAGITVKIEQTDEATWAGKVYGKAPAEFDAALSWFAGYADAGMVTKWWNPDVAGFNAGFMKADAALSEAIDAAGKATGAARTEALAKVCQEADRDAQMIPLVTRPVTVAYRTDALSPSLYATEGYGNVLRLLPEIRAKKAQ